MGRGQAGETPVSRLTSSVWVSLALSPGFEKMVFCTRGRHGFPPD